MLEIKNISVFYGRHRAVEDLSVRVSKGEIVVMLGANGAGKSTFLRAIAGITPYMEGGSISIEGRDITHLPPHEIVEAGIALVPEGRGVFADLTVQENLALGANPQRARHLQSDNLERVLSLFPRLAERQRQIVRTMSGGEQQMVAIGRAIMSSPVILMLDEPSLGLSPLLCKELFQNLAKVREAGLGILLVEQNAKQSLAIADRGYLLENSQITKEDTASNLMNDPAVQKAYLGGAGDTRNVATPTATPDPLPSPLIPEPAFRLSSHKARLRTDDLLNESIGDLVQRAADIQSYHIKTIHTEPLESNVFWEADDKGNDHLYEVLAMIEKAAADARKPEPFQPIPQVSRNVKGKTKTGKRRIK